MDLINYLDKKSIIIGVKGKNKRAIVSDILDSLIENEKIKKDSKKEILKVILKREDMGSTAIGGHIALPHARMNNIKDLMICLCISEDGVDFVSLDQEPVNIIALLLSNQKEAGLHLKMLAFLAKMLRDKYFVQRLKKVKNQEEALALIKKQQQAII